MLEPLVTEILEPITPWEAFLRVSHRRWPVFFDSAVEHASLGRYSFVAADPMTCWIAKQSNEVLPTLSKLQTFLSHQPLRHRSDLPPFQTGIAGLFSYTMCEALENIPAPRINDLPLPYVAVGFYPWVIAFDHLQNRSWFIQHPKARTETVKSVLSTSRKDEKKEFRNTTNPEPLASKQFALKLEGYQSNFDREKYLRTVARCVEYIRSGDCFQINLSQRLLLPYGNDPLLLYSHLREASPALCGGYFQPESFSILSTSPERFISLDETGRMETRPIKGTRPRHTNPVIDNQLAEELKQSSKDRAENVMIVDLMRNDLGRVSEYGSISVPKLCGLESNTSVHHLVSVVEGKLKPGLDAVDVLKVGLPGGSVTGAPKVRAMQIISELEPNSRGAYCGCLGYLSLTGTMDTSILIRTLILNRGWATFSVGGGIVADSIPEQEFDETLHKASGIFRTFERIAIQHS